MISWIYIFYQFPAAQQTISKKKDSVATEATMPPSVEPEIMVPDFSDMRHYNELLKEIPQESASVPLILHCLVEQVRNCLKTFGMKINNK